MIQFLLIVGLPGSGKTFYSRQLEGIVFDDINDLSVLKEDLQGKITIIDPHFCCADILARAKDILGKKYPNCKIDVTYFENDLEACWANVQRRNDNRKISYSFVKSLSSDYFPPKNSRGVYKCE
jgi:predicted kinase